MRLPRDGWVERAAEATGVEVVDVLGTSDDPVVVLVRRIPKRNRERVRNIWRLFQPAWLRCSVRELSRPQEAVYRLGGGWEKARPFKVY